MRGMILAAGRGERMGALTTELPKPLLKVGDRHLIDYSLLAFARAGIKEVVINISYHAEKIKHALGDGARYGVKIFYSEEEERLETGGGVFKALPLLGSHPFIVLSSDIIADYDLTKLPKEPQGLMHLVMVDNPAFHPAGDYYLRDQKLYTEGQPKLTFGNISVFRPELFASCQPGFFRLTKLFNAAISAGQATGEHFRGTWHNVGTPAELNALNQSLV